MAGAVTVLVLIVLAASAFIESLVRGLGGGSDLPVVSLLEGHLLPLLLLGLSVAAYQLLGPEENMIEEVFG